MWGTTSFKPHQLVHLIYTALLLGLNKQKIAAQTTFKLKPETKYCVEKAIEVVEKKGYRWGKFDLKIGQSVKVEKQRMSTRPKRGMSEKDAYYIIKELGYGSTSNVFHAVTSLGDEVAIKLYLSNVGVDGTPLSIDEFREQGKAATEMEAKNLIKMYPFLKGKVKPV